MTAPLTPWARPVTIVAAVAANGVIGDGTSMPWRLPLELALFRRTTAGAALVMGRRTFEGLPGGLPGRHVFLVTSGPGPARGDVTVARSPVEAIAAAILTDRPVFVAGGAAVYEASIPFADRLRITRLRFDAEGGTLFPGLDASEWSDPASLDEAVEPGGSWRVECRRRVAPAKRRAP